MSSSNERSRVHVSTSGTFLSVPAAFDGAPEGLIHALKVEIVPRTTVTREPGQKTKQSFTTATITDRALIDFGAVDPDAIDFGRIERDCELLVEALHEHPDVVRQALDVVCGGPTSEEEIASATAALSEIGLTEQGTLVSRY